MNDKIIRASIATCIFVLGYSSGAFAQGLEDRSYANIDECKAYVDELRQEDIEKLNKRKRMMGAGMPNSVYSRKKGKIQKEYDANLISCESLVTSRAR